MTDLTAASERVTEADRDPLASLASQVRHADTGTQARLRRSHPLQDRNAALFETEWMLQTAHVQARSMAERDRWALLVHCLAIVRGAHQGGAEAEPGRVLAELRVSEARLRQLVEADEHVLADLMPRLARRIAAAGRTMNWRPLADLMLYTGTAQEDRADQARLRLIARYLESEARANSEGAQAVTPS